MSAYEHIYTVVRAIPPGKVASYGQVAKVAGLANHARLVGYALAALEDDSVPWHRVVNAQGKLSLRHGQREQRLLLQAEGIEVSESGRLDLVRHRWLP